MKKHSAQARELRLLIYKYAKGTLTANEKIKLDNFMNRSPENASLVELLISPDGPARLLERQARMEKMWEGHKFLFVLRRLKRKRRRPILQLNVVTILVLMLLIGSTCFLLFLLWTK